MARSPERGGRGPERTPRNEDGTGSGGSKPAPKPAPTPTPKAGRRGRSEARGSRRSEGHDTASPVSHVNAPESDVELYKDSMVGKRIGKCEIDKLIGEGKTSVVYRAHYVPLDRTVAVKVLQEHMAKMPAVLRVFEQEGRAVAALDHENILKIYDVGEDDGRHYLVLELLRGHDLLYVLDHSDEGRLEVNDALDYVRQTAAGLAVAHRKGIIHRDIKPQNLVLEPDGTIKIVDFGLAAEAEGAYAGGRIGTPHYMPPEQCRGEKAVPASDIYALGITLFHMLVGHPPYSGKATTEEIIEAHLAARRLEPEKLVAGLPRPVCDLVRRMTRQDAGARPDAREVVEIVGKLTPERLERGADVHARGKSKAARRVARREEASKGPPVVLLVGGGLVALLVIVLLMLGKGGDEGSSATGTSGDGSATSAGRTGGKTGQAGTGSSTASTNGEPTVDALEKLLADAKYEENTGNWREALYLYRRLEEKTPRNSPLHLQAREAQRLINDKFKDDTDEEGNPVKKARFISNEESEATGAQFTEKWPGWVEDIKWFQVETPLNEMRPLVDTTREETPERRHVEGGIRRAELIQKLLMLLESRAQALPADKARWTNVDIMAGGSLLIMAADARGVHLRDESTGLDEARYWATIGFDQTLAVVELLRNPKSAEEALMVGFLCQLHGDARAASYYGFAEQLDSSAEMRQSIKELKQPLLEEE